MSDFESKYSSEIINLFTDIKLYCEDNALDLLTKRNINMNYIFYKLIYKHVNLKEEHKEDKENNIDDIFD
tara:strand:+ start:919 stop:1128 length:210 start_codon:yes stop_codon:yes gene_type:complete